MIKLFALTVNGRNYRVCALMFLLTIFGGCAGGSPDSSPEPEPPRIVVEANQTLSSGQGQVERSVDIYRATNADKAIVFLHGGAGNKHIFAYNIGINLSDVDSNYDAVNEQILLDNHAIAVFPQGKSIAEAPGAYTWNNYVMDSGEDDIQFLRDLVNFISTRYHVSKFYIVGHSNGGMMVNRTWCEAPELFDAYISIAGPPSEHFLSTPCSPPAEVKPYMGIVGSLDDVLQNTGKWEEQTWTIKPAIVLGAYPAFVNSVLIGERYFLPYRVNLRCGETVHDGDTDAIVDGNITTWSFCNNSVKLMRVEDGEHSMQSMEIASGHSMLDIVLDFIN